MVCSSHVFITLRINLRVEVSCASLDTRVLVVACVDAQWFCRFQHSRFHSLTAYAHLFSFRIRVLSSLPVIVSFNKVVTNMVTL